MFFLLLLASIISKKAAAGIKYLILDLKVGISSFFQSIDEAKIFGKQFVSYSNNFIYSLIEYILN
jgi:thymidine phosphorylase